MKFRRGICNLSCKKITSSVFLTLILLFTIVDKEATSQNNLVADLDFDVNFEFNDGKGKPLELSRHDFTFNVGHNSTVFLYPAEAFNTTFENYTSLTLHFTYSISGVITPLPDVPLLANPPFHNTSLEIVGLTAGRVIVTSLVVPPEPEPVQSSPVNNIFLRISIYKYGILLILSDIVGWIYFLAWSVSFYPQIYQNWKRKSVRGLSLDFVFLNITGFIVYAVFNVGLFWIPELQLEYMRKFPTGVIPVQLNDVIFSLHAVFATSITLTQCIIYDKGTQTVSGVGRSLLMGIILFLFVMLIVALSNNAISWLTLITICSYVKLFITLIKYIPQAYLNWSRKSTSGWSIGNVLLDFTGGAFSILQMFIIAYNHNDWTSISGDLTKFGLGLFSILFDVFFIIQHYFLYRNHYAYEPIDGANVLNDDAYEDMVTSNHIIDPQDDEDEEYQHHRSSSSASSSLSIRS